MRNTTNRKCPACSVMLQQVSGSTAVCPKCFRQFSYQNTAFRSQTPTAADEKDMEKSGTAIILLIVGIVLTFSVGLLPLAVFLTVMLIKTCKKVSENPAAQPQPVRYVPCGKQLQTRGDYIRSFSAMQLYDMPLGPYGERALHQIEQLEQKQQALTAMLGKEHPFIKNGNEAETYILKNCKQILYRLKFCDQTDPDLCRAHADFLEGRLADNEKILRDFENLIIEVSQLDLDTPETKPCLDVLAATLHDVRTQDGALPDAVMYHDNEQIMLHRMTG